MSSVSCRAPTMSRFHADSDLVNVGSNGGQVDLDGLVVTIALAGTVVAGVFDRTVSRLQVIIEDEIGIGTDFTVSIDEVNAPVEIELGTVGSPSVPTKTHQYLAQARSLLGKRDVSTLGQ